MKLIENLISGLLIGIIKTYKYLISPLLGPNCRFLPTCSDYFIESIQKKGLDEKPPSCSCELCPQPGKEEGCRVADPRSKPVQAFS